MKRDMELIRKILLDIESSTSYATGAAGESYWDHYTHVRGDEYSSYTDSEIRLAIELIDSAGFAMIPDRIIAGPKAVKGLTWQGYEYLEKIRDTQRWEKIKKKLEPIGDFSYDAIKDAISQITAEQIKFWIPIAIYTAIVYSFGLFSRFFK